MRSRAINGRSTERSTDRAKALVPKKATQAQRSLPRRLRRIIRKMLRFGVGSEVESGQGERTEEVSGKEKSPDRAIASPAKSKTDGYDRRRFARLSREPRFLAKCIGPAGATIHCKGLQRSRVSCVSGVSDSFRIFRN